MGGLLSILQSVRSVSDHSVFFDAVESVSATGRNERLHL